MKVWVIGRNYPSPGNNRQGSFELEQAKMLGKRGNDITYIACVLHPFWRINGGGFVAFDDAPVKVRAYSGFFTPHMTNPLVQAPYFPKLRNKKWEKLLEKTEMEIGLPDVIHIHFPLMVMASEVFKKYHARGVKIVVTEHWTKVINKNIDAFEKKEMISFLEFADSYIAVGLSLKRAIEEITGTNREIFVMPNIINDLFQPSDMEHEDFYFGLVGRLVTEKQMDKVIRAFAENFKGQKTIHLIIVGDGSKRKALEQLTDVLGIQGQVVFKGSLSREDTANVVKTLDCLICFSRYETFGVPVIEAWACGVPVITTTADCITDQWDDRMGISVNCDDEEALKKGMTAMLFNKYDRRNIAEVAHERYSEDAIYKKMIAIYDR